MTDRSRKLSILASTFIITALLFGVVFTGGVLATTDDTEEQHRTYTLQDGDTRYYGMNLTYSDANITSGETWEISHPNGDNITATTDSGSVTFDTNQITNYSSAEGTQAEVLDASGNTVITFNLEEQGFASEFTSDYVANSGSTTVDLNLFTSRTDPQYDVIVSENSGTLTNSEIAGLSPAFTVQTLDAGAGSEVVLAEDYSGDVTETLDFSGIPADVYDFTFEVRDSPSSSDPAPVVSDTATIDVRDQEPGTLSGTVATGNSDYTGPINIEIENTSTGETFTDSTTGTSSFPYSFDGLEPGTYNVFATAEEHRDFTTEVTINEGATTEQNIELERETATFNGSVSTEETQSYFEVGASLVDSNGNTIDTDFGQTADPYAYELTGFVGETYTVQFDAEYHVQETTEEITPTSDGQTITDNVGLDLKRGTFEGVVSTEQTDYTGDIVVEYEHLPSGDAGQTTSSGDTFNYSQSNQKAGEYELTYSAPDGSYETVTQNVTIDTDGETVTAPDVTLTQTNIGSVTGTINTENTAYDGQISVDLTNIDTGDIYTETGTGSSLSYSFNDIPTGDYEITANAENHDAASSTFQLSDGQTYEYNTTLTQQALTTIEGTVDVEDSSYNGDITVRLLDQSTGSEEDSVTGSGSSSYSYQFQDIPAGSYTVEASANNHTTETSDVSVNDGETVLQNFSLTSETVAQGTYSGTYSTGDTDYSGPITVNIQDTDTTFETTLDGSGPEFTFNETLDKGDYDVTVSADLHEDYTTTITVPADGGVSDSATLTQSPTGSLSANVETGDTSYSGDITSTITNQDTGETITRTVSGSSGSFVEVLETGNYELAVDAQGHEEVTQTFSITEDTTTTQSVTLPELTQGAQGTVTTGDSEYTGPITLEFTNQNTGNVVTAEGTGPQYEYDVGLDAGTYDLSVSANDHSTANETITVQNDSITSNNYTLSQIQVDIEISVDVNTIDGSSYGPVDVRIEGPSSDTVTIEDGSTQTVTLAGTGTYEVFAENNNLTEDRQTVNADSDSTFSTSLAPDEQDSGTLEVTASTEESVDQINISVEDDTGTEVATDTISSSSGVSEFTLESGEYTVVTSADGHETQETTVPVSIGELTTVEAALNLTSVDYFDGSIVWVGQVVNFSDVASEGDEVRFVNQESGDVYEVVLENGTTLESTVIQEQVGTGDLDVSVNGTSEGVLSLQEQTLDASYASKLELPNRTSATFALETNREGTQTIVFDSIETPSGDTLDGSVLADGNDAIVDAPDNNAEYTFNASSITLQTQFDNLDLTTGEYTVNTFVKDTGVESSATLTVNAEETLENLVADETINDGGLFWVGQTLKYEGDEVNTGQTYRIVTEEDGQLVQEIQPRQSDGAIIFNTEDQSEGDYQITDTDGNVIISYLLREQTFSSEISAEEVLNSGVQTTADVEFSSNRGTYDVIIEDGYGIDKQDLASRISGASVVEQDFDEDGEVEEEVVVRSIGLAETIEFQDYPTTGQANFTFTVLDTGVTSESSIEVLELEDATPSFSQQFYESYEGDIAEIEVVMPQGVETADVTIGGEERFGYEATVTLTDSVPTERSTAVIQMNTLSAGQGETDVTFDVETLSKEDEAGIVNGEVQRETQIPEGRTLDPTNYLLTLRSDGVEQDLSGLKHYEIEIDGSATYISPQTTSLEEISDRLAERADQEQNSEEDGNNNNENNSEDDSELDISGSPPVDENAPFYESVLVTESNTVATPDTMYLYYNVNGFEETLRKNSTTASDFEMDSAFSQENGFELEIERANPPINYNGETFGPSDIEYHYDEENEFVFFEFSPSLLNEDKVSPGDKFEATLTINSDNPVIEETEGDGEEISSTVEFEVVEPKYTFNDPVEVEPSNEQKIFAETTLAPQTDVQLVARSDDVTYPFLYKQEATVDANGVVSGEFDFSGAPVGYEFEMIVEGLSEPKDAVVVEDRTTLDVTPAEDEEGDGEEGEGEGEGDGEEGEGEGEGDGEETEGTSVPVTFELTNQSGASLDGTISVDGEPQEVSNGELTTELTSGTEYEFRANAPDYASQTVVREITEGQEPIEFQLEEIEEQHRVDIRVIDSNEEDIVGAEVSTGDGETATVGENGTATLQLEDGDYTLTASAEDYEDSSIDITVDGEDRSEVIELSEASSDGGDSDGSDSSDGGDSDGGDSDGSDGGDDEDVRSPGQPGFTAITVTLALLALAMYVRRQ